jgi:hypothetical protein
VAKSLKVLNMMIISAELVMRGMATTRTAGTGGTGRGTVGTVGMARTVGRGRAGRASTQTILWDYAVI